MKKHVTTSQKPLRLATQTIRTLDRWQLVPIAGGATPTCYCIIIEG